MATAKKTVAKKKPAKKAKAGSDAKAVLKRMQAKRAQSPDSCIFC